MNVAELCLSPGKGGLELYAFRVARRLSRSNVACVSVVAHGTQLESLLQAEGLPYLSLKVAFRWFPLAAARRLARWIEAEAVDVIHLHWGSDLSLAVLARCFARRAVRLVYSRQMALTRAKHDWYHRWLYRRVDLLLAMTQRLEREARRFLPLPPERIRLLHVGVEEPPCAEPSRCGALRARFNIPDGCFTVGLFGRVEPAKGQHVLIDALGSLARRGRDVHAVLFGHPMRPKYLDELHSQVTRLDLAGRVHYYGFHPRPGEVMGCFDCIVLATYNETFGLVLVEAMRAGVAVIGTDAGGVPEIIDDGETGLLVPPRDPTALASAIERLAADSDLRGRLARAGKASADARFAEEEHFERLVACLAGRTER